MKSSYREFGYGPVIYRYEYTLACIEVLRGIIAHENLDTILQSEMVYYYLSSAGRGSRQEYELAKRGLEQLYAKHAASDRETCQQAIRDIIDMYAPGDRERMPYVQLDFAKLMGFLAEKYDCQSVFEPYAGRGTLSEYLPKNTSYAGQEVDEKLCRLANLRLEALDKGDYCVALSDGFGLYQRADMIMSESPWGMNIPGPERQSSENFFLQEASYFARKISVGIYPYGILFRTNRDKDLRARLVESDLIDCVIKLPARLYAPATNVQTCIIITNRHKTNEGYVRFIDASSFVVPGIAYTRLDVERLIRTLELPELDKNYSMWVANHTILAEKGVDLNMEHYQPVDLPEVPEGSVLKPLKDILVSLNRRKPTELPNVPLIRVSDLAVNPFDFSLGETLPTDLPYNRSYVYVDEPALLISKFQPLKPTYFVAKCGGVFINPNIYAFRVDTDVVSPQYLLSELTKDYVRKQLVYSGTSVQRLTQQTFLDVKILLPLNREEQDLAVTKRIQEEKERGKQTISEAKSSYDAEWRDRQHTLGHVAAQVTLVSHALDELMREQNGVLRYDNIVDLVKEESVQEYFEKLIFNVDRASFLIKHLADKEELGLPDKPIFLKEFFTAYKKQHVLPNFVLDIKEVGSKFAIAFAIENWRTVIDNIFSNIKKYAFPDAENIENNIVVIRTESTKLHDAPAVSILIMNNGAPLDESMTPEMVFRWGKTSSKDQTGHGLGGNHIKKLVEHFGGEVEFLVKDNLEPGYSTAYKIVLPIVNE